MLIPGPSCMPCFFCLGFLRNFLLLFPIFRNFTVVCLGVVCFAFIVLSTWWAIQFGNSWPLVLETFLYYLIFFFFTSICLLGVLSGTPISQSQMWIDSLFLKISSLLFFSLLYFCSTSKIFSTLHSFSQWIFSFAFIFIIPKSSFLFSESFFLFLLK